MVRGYSVVDLARVGVTLGLATLASCGGRIDPTPVEIERVASCVPGQQIDCACRGAASSVQVCRDDGTYEPCACADDMRSSSSSPSSNTGGSGGSGTTQEDTSGSSSSGGAGGTSAGTAGSSNDSSGNTDAGGTSPTGDEPDSGVVLRESFSETSQLVDIVVTDPGIVIITTDLLLLVDRGGEELDRIELEREATAAAFDASLLVVADRGKFTTYGLDLSEITSATLAESCVSAVLVSDARFICGPSNDWDRVFYTYDAMSGELLATSEQYTYNGIPMRRVPGTDDFVTVTVGTSPADFHLYRVSENGEAVFINESPYHGDFRVTNVYSFDAEPPQHLITDTGLLLSLTNELCSADETAFTSQCFEKDGDLGTLTGDQLFRGMDTDGEGKVWGLVDPSPGYFSDPICDSGCLLQRIDVASRSIDSQKLVHLAAGEIQVLRRDPVTNGFAVGYRQGEGFVSSLDPYPGYGVAYFEF